MAHAFNFFVKCCMRQNCMSTVYYSCHPFPLPSVVAFVDWEYTKMTDGLKSGTYAAIVGDYGQVAEIVQSDTSCKMHMLPDIVGRVSKAFAYGVDFFKEHPDVVDLIDSTILELQQDGAARVRPLASKLSKPMHAVSSKG
jgi:hypothetical protein